MPTPTWRELASACPTATLLPDIERYADVFEAIDEAVDRAATWEPSPSDLEPVAQTDVIDDDGNIERTNFFAVRVAVAPVKTPSTVRLCIALMQYNHWRHHVPTTQAGLSGAMLPHVDTLLKRKLMPAQEELVDLARFLLMPIRQRPDLYGEPSAPLLRLIEIHTTPPAQHPLRDVLIEARRRVEVMRNEYVNTAKRFRMRPQTVRFDKWMKRLSAMIG